MIIIVCFLLCVGVSFLIINILLKKRSRTNSNKFVENGIKKTFLKYFLKVNRRGWQIHTLKSDVSIENFKILSLRKIKWFYLNNKECSGIADPFLFKQNSIYYLFFEYEYHKNLNKGADLAYASSHDGVDWKFENKILEESFHQSFPYVFQYENETYMLPESYQSNQVRLYKSVKFPEKWELDTVLFEGLPLVDTIFYQKESVFYWITTNLETDALELYTSQGMRGKWNKHPSSPLSEDLKNNRNAGAIIEENGKIYRLAQDGTLGYGSGVNLYEIVSLSEEVYKEVDVKEPLLFKSVGGIKDAIHHVSIYKDENEKIFAIDGANFSVNGIKLG